MPLLGKPKDIPKKTGVYIMKDVQGEVIYVGKAVSLKSRVASYFQPSDDPKVSAISRSVSKVEYIITLTEEEALLLESNLIKRHRPRYNIRLKDDKSWLYMKITKGDWPRLLLTRTVRDDGGRYYGPFTSGRATRKTLKVLRRLFGLRGCSLRIKGKDRPCLDYHIGLCTAPCGGRIEREAYKEVAGELDSFMKGGHDKYLKGLEREMKAAAENQNFETAGLLRDQMEAAREIIASQRLAIPPAYSQDVIALARMRDLASVQVFFVREGRIQGREQFFLEGIQGEQDPGILASFIEQFYSSSGVPKEIVIQHEITDGSLRNFLGHRRGSRVNLMVPQRGKKLSLLRMAAKNADHALALELLKREERGLRKGAVLALQRELDLEFAPSRIEAFDISNIGGAQAVGSMVSFVEGQPVKKEYRRFRIRTVKGIDDNAMMREVVFRRYKKQPVPDLVVIDGGRGQLKAALDALRDQGAHNVQVLGLAKKLEEVYLPHREDPIRMPQDSKGLLLLRKIRDEAHRFAVAYHRKLRDKKMVRSVLDDIPGIGRERKGALLKHFGSVKRLKAASVEEIGKVPGIGPKTARIIFTALHPQ